MTIFLLLKWLKAICLKTLFKEVAAEHGIQFPTHQSLSHPPLKYAELLGQLPANHALQKQRSGSVIVKHYGTAGGNGSDGGGEGGREQRDEKENRENAEESDGISTILLNTQLGLDSSQLQRCLGRWSKTITMFTRVIEKCKLIIYL